MREMPINFTVVLWKKRHTIQEDLIDGYKGDVDWLVGVKRNGGVAVNEKFSNALNQHHAARIADFILEHAEYDRGGKVYSGPSVEERQTECDHVLSFPKGTKIYVCPCCNMTMKTFGEE